MTEEQKERRRERQRVDKKRYYQENKAEFAARQKEYQKTHRAEINARQKKYRESHKAEVDAWYKNYREANKERIAAYMKEYGEARKGKKNEYMRQYNKTHKVRMRNYRLQREFGIGLSEYDQMFINQNGCCAICGRHQSGLRGILGVDHDHETGMIRGLLCNECNFLLGYAHDETGILASAIQYLEAATIRMVV